MHVRKGKRGSNALSKFTDKLVIATKFTELTGANFKGKPTHNEEWNKSKLEDNSTTFIACSSTCSHSSQISDQVVFTFFPVALPRWWGPGWGSPQGLTGCRGEDTRPIAHQETPGLLHFHTNSSHHTNLSRPSPSSPFPTPLRTKFLWLEEVSKPGSRSSPCWPLLSRLGAHRRACVLSLLEINGAGGALDGTITCSWVKDHVYLGARSIKPRARSINVWAAGDLRSARYLASLASLGQNFKRPKL